jgi:hypothetical protein
MLSTQAAHSEYSQLNLTMNYQGSANKIRIAIRNYDSAYSRPDDGNSTKFNAIQVHALELTKEIHLALSSFAVADWWLSQYNILLSKSLSELNNAMVITLACRGLCGAVGWRRIYCDNV